MTLGHGSMALETTYFIYTGLTLLVFGSGFFKPNMTSIISQMYKGRDDHAFLMLWKSLTPISKFFAMVAVPEFPGATNSRLQIGLFAIFQANVCSRPPAPNTSTFID